jgi:hypothetical protein
MYRIPIGANLIEVFYSNRLLIRHPGGGAPGVLARGGPRNATHFS